VHLLTYLLYFLLQVVSGRSYFFLPGVYFLFLSLEFEFPLAPSRQFAPLYPGSYLRPVSFIHFPDERQREENNSVKARVLI